MAVHSISIAFRRAGQSGRIIASATVCGGFIMLSYWGIVSSSAVIVVVLVVLACAFGIVVGPVSDHLVFLLFHCRCAD